MVVAASSEAPAALSVFRCSDWHGLGSAVESIFAYRRDLTERSFLGLRDAACFMHGHRGALRGAPQIARSYRAAGLRAFAHPNTHRGTHRHDAGLWTCRPPSLRPRRHAPRNTSPRRRTADLAPQRLRPCRHAPKSSPGCRSFASAPSPSPTRAEENFATRPPASCQRRRAPRNTSP